MNLSEQKQDLVKNLVRLEPERGKPSIFNTNCSVLPNSVNRNSLQPLVERKWDTAEVAIVNLPTPEYDVERIEHGIIVAGAMGNMAHFVWLLVRLSLGSKYINSDDFFKSINYNGSNQGAVAIEIKHCLYTVWNTYRPMKIDGLINALRTYGPPYWHKCDYNTNYRLSYIIDTVMTMLNADLVTKKENDIVPECPAVSTNKIEENNNKLSNYFKTTNEIEGMSSIKTIFNLNLLNENLCSTCNRKWCTYTTNWFFKLPLIGTSAHYWYITHDLIYSSAIIDLTPTQILNTDYMSLITLLITTIQNNDNNNNNNNDNNNNKKIKLVANTFVNIDNKTRYVIFASFLQKLDNGYQWQATTVNKLSHKLNFIQYCRQRKYSIVIQQLPPTNNVLCTTDTDFGFETQVYQIVHSNETIETIPQKYPIISFAQTKQQTQIKITTVDEKNNSNEFTPLLRDPPGFNTISLSKQIKHVMQNGYVTENNCKFCKKITNVILKQEIFHLPMIWLMYLDQGDAAMLSIDWTYQNDKTEINTDAQNTKQFAINAYIAQHTKTNFTSHWRDKATNKEWIKLENTQISKYKDNIGNTDHTKACLLYIFNY